MTINKRIEAHISECGLSLRKYAEKIGVAQSSLFGCVNGNEPKYSTLNKILTTFPDLSADWLLLGTGSMLRQEASAATTINGNEHTIVNSHINGNVRQNIAYPINKVADSRTDVLPYVADWYSMPDLSMSPDINQGDRLGLTEYSGRIINGNIYALDVKGIGLLVRICNSDPAGTLTLSAFNQRYRDMTIPADEVLHIYKVEVLTRIVL